MKRAYFCVLISVLALPAVSRQASAQGMIPTCTAGYHIEIADTPALSSLRDEAIGMNTLSDDMRKKQQAAKTDDEAAQAQATAEQADQNKSAAVSAMLTEQGKSMRCVANR